MSAKYLFPYEAAFSGVSEPILLLFWQSDHQSFDFGCYHRSSYCYQKIRIGVAQL